MERKEVLQIFPWVKEDVVIQDLEMGRVMEGAIKRRVLQTVQIYQDKTRTPRAHREINAIAYWLTRYTREGFSMLLEAMPKENGLDHELVQVWKRAYAMFDGLVKRGAGSDTEGEDVFVERGARIVLREGDIMKVDGMLNGLLSDRRQTALDNLRYTFGMANEQGELND